MFKTWSDAAVVGWAVAHLVSVAFLELETPGQHRRHRQRAPFQTACALLAGGSVALWVVSNVSAVVGEVVFGAAAYLVFARWLKRLSPPGVLVWWSFLLMGVALGVWGVRFLASLHVSATTTGLLWAALVAGAVTIPPAVMQTFEGWEVLLRRDWARPRKPLTNWRPSGAVPKVSIHVPAHAEPPELVISTLNRLASLTYPEFEVLVIDNNTTDPALWRPVEEHCRQLGSRFRFFHVEGITGAKAGALNWVTPFVDPDAELVGVVDADYAVSPDWLMHTVGFFDDPNVGFVQCPHAYRDFAGSRFGRMANTEYSVFFATSMVSLNEHGAGITVGTMSLVRRHVLEQVGGWAEWCLTEDSELSIRIHAAGYSSVYLAKPYGWGLIPETFSGYKKQRFRWTYGPVQELQRHFPLFVPGARRRPSALNARQRAHHANHGLDVAMIGVRWFVIPLGAAAMISMVWHREKVPMPLPLWISATAILVSSYWMRWLVYRRAIGATLSQALGGIVAYLALTHVITIASLTALRRKPVPWQRTDKFKPSARRNTVLAASGVETLLALGCVTLAALGFALLPSGGISRSLALGVGWMGMSYAAAPLLAWIAEKDLRKQLKADTITQAQPGGRQERDRQPQHQLVQAPAIETRVSSE